MPRISDPSHSPFIFFEIAPVFRCDDSVISVTLMARRDHVGADGLAWNDHAEVAYLRGSVAAATSLRNILNEAINAALLIATPAAGRTQ
jgi:hypothetical protein